MHFELAAQRRPQSSHVEPDRLHVRVRRRQQGRIGHVAAQPVRNDCLDLGNRVRGCFGQLRIGQGLDDACAQDEGFDLLLLEHQRWEIEAGFEHVADTGLPFDGNAACDQVLNVAIDGPLRDLQRLAQIASAHRSLAAHELYDFEQSVGAAHAANPQSRLR